jgi:hypothetical protein
LGFPFENAGAGGSGLCFGDMAGLLQGYRECGVGERIVRGQGGEREGGSYGLFETACVAKGTNEAVVCLEGSGIRGDGGAEGFDGEGSIAGGELIHCALAEFFGCVRLSHGIL